MSFACTSFRRRWALYWSKANVIDIILIYLPQISIIAIINSLRHYIFRCNIQGSESLTCSNTKFGWVNTFFRKVNTTVYMMNTSQHFLRTQNITNTRETFSQREALELPCLQSNKTHHDMPYRKLHDSCYRIIKEHMYSAIKQRICQPFLKAYPPCTWLDLQYVSVLAEHFHVRPYADKHTHTGNWVKYK